MVPHGPTLPPTAAALPAASESAPRCRRGIRRRAGIRHVPSGYDIRGTKIRCTMRCFAVMTLRLLVVALAFCPAVLAQDAVGGDRSTVITDSVARTVSGACWGGSGEMSVTVHAASDNQRIRVDVIGRRMAEGSRWQVSSPRGRGEFEFHRRATDGGWFATFTVNARTRVGVLVAAEERSSHGEGSCLVLNSGSRKWQIGLISCTPRRLSSLSTRHMGDSTTVIASVLDNKEGARWHLKLTARDDFRMQTVEFDDTTNKHGNLRSRVDLRGLNSPSLKLVAEREDGRQCRVGLDPGQLATDQTMTPRRLVNAARLLTRENH